MTDADAVLGFLPASGFAGGRMTLDVAAAADAISAEVRVAAGARRWSTPRGIERIVNANMANGMRRVLAGYGADPRRLALVAYGGNGAVRACALADELRGVDGAGAQGGAGVLGAGVPTVADYAVDLVRSYVTPISQVDLGRLRGLLAEVADEAAKELAPAGLPADAVAVEQFVLMAYSGQNSAMSVPCPEGAGVVGGRPARPGRALPRAARVRPGLRLPQPAAPAAGRPPRWPGASPPSPSAWPMLGTDAGRRRRSGTRPVHFGHGYVDTPIVDGSVLGARLRRRPAPA